jgi:hypothetical protein
MLELFKGQLEFDKIKYDMSYKEALLLRDVRVERLKNEREEIERERQSEAKKQQNEASRNKLYIPN